MRLRSVLVSRLLTVISRYLVMLVGAPCSTPILLPLSSGRQDTSRVSRAMTVERRLSAHWVPITFATASHGSRDGARQRMAEIGGRRRQCTSFRTCLLTLTPRYRFLAESSRRPCLQRMARSSQCRATTRAAAHTTRPAQTLTYRRFPPRRHPRLLGARG